jgi:hypothetical protein
MNAHHETTADQIFAALIQGNFRKATRDEQTGFGGCEGECWLWENFDEICVADFQNYSTRFSLITTGAEGEQHEWILNPFTGIFRQII